MPPLHSSSSFSWISPDLAHTLQTGGTTAHRLCSSPTAWVERLGEDLLINHQSPTQLDTLLQQWRTRAQDYPFSISRIFSRCLPRHNELRSAPLLLEGDPNLPLETVVSESHVLYGLDFTAGYAVGLFLDQRANRLLLRQNPGRRLLNTFAYTGSFSVVAALSGAETLSIDLSRKSLNRAKANFQINHISPDPHRFLAEDVLLLLPKLIRRGETFDSIILDPPTFSRGHKNRPFKADQDLGSLLDLALQLSSPNAKILLSTNCSKIQPKHLESLARSSLKNVRRAASFQTPPPLPDFQNASAASCLWIHLR
jgi:23S rRNA (cytosine1962-C5)-methyltransferase